MHNVMKIRGYYMGENGSWKGFQLHNHFKLVLSYRDGLQLAGHSVDISASICMQVRYLQHRVTSITFVSMARSLKQALYFQRHHWLNY